MSTHDETPLDPPAHTRRAGDLHAPATTTAEQERTTHSQRRINLIWELTQAFVTAAITAAEIYSQLHRIDSAMLNAAFFAVITTYLARTNHTKVGGVPFNYTGR